MSEEMKILERRERRRERKRETVPYGPQALTKVNMVGPRERNPLESTAGQVGVFFKVHNLGR